MLIGNQGTQSMFKFIKISSILRGYRYYIPTVNMLINKQINSCIASAARFQDF